MANVLSGLMPDLFAAVDIISQEIVGFLNAVGRNSKADSAGVDQPVYVPIVPTPTGEDITPGRMPPDTVDQTISKRPITMTKQRVYPFRWTAEEQHSMDSGGPGYDNLRAQQIAQSLRGIVNEMEADVAVECVKASRAYGTPGTTPFASNLADTAQIRKLLIDNGAPTNDLHLVMNTTAGANVRTLGQLTKANEAGTQQVLRQGELIDIHGMALRESAFVQEHTKGTGTGYVTNLGAPLAIGATAIAVDTGSGTIVAGDVVTFAGDTNKYVVTTALSGGSFTIAAPGLLKALADGVAVTVANSYTANMAFARSSIVMATRVPASPKEHSNGGGILLDRQVIQDPRTRLAFEFTAWGGYRTTRYEVGAVWGVDVIKPEHLVLLLG
jgi:hypothetical protein